MFHTVTSAYRTDPGYNERFAQATTAELLRKVGVVNELKTEKTVMTELVDLKVDEIMAIVRDELETPLAGVTQWFTHAEPPSPSGSTPTRKRTIYLTVIP